MTISSKEALFGPAPRRYKDLTLPVAGHAVRIRSLSERELSAYTTVPVNVAGEGKALRQARIEDSSRRLICLCLVDDAGNRLLSDSDAPRLEDWDSADTQYLAGECQRWVGLSGSPDLETHAKNSAAATDAA